jgi:hypothetical protein
LLSGRIDHDRSEARFAAERAAFFLRPLCQAPRLDPQNLKDAALGRSHRAKIGKAKLKLAIELTREVLEVPAGYKIGIVPASDTGAVEMALWSLLGARPVTTIAWESFGEGWVSDIVKELKLKDVTKLHAGYGEIPDLAKADPASDIVFTWNGTTSGVRVPNADWIKARPRRPHHLRRDLGGVRAEARLGQARCRDVLLAERRWAARPRTACWCSVAARGRAARELHAGLAAAEDLPHDQGRQAQRGHLRGRDHQHAVDAVRRGLSRRAELGQIGRRPQGPDGARRRQHQGARRLEGENAVDRFPGRRIRLFVPTPRCA